MLELDPSVKLSLSSKVFIGLTALNWSLETSASDSSSAEVEGGGPASPSCFSVSAGACKSIGKEAQKSEGPLND